MGYVKPFTQAQRERRNKTIAKWGRAHPKQSWVIAANSRAKRRAIRADVEYNLSTEYLAAVTEDKCPVFDTPFVFRGMGVTYDASPSLDRLDPKAGYVKGNVIVISLKANRIKSAYTSDDVFKVAFWLKDAGY